MPVVNCISCGRDTRRVDRLCRECGVYCETKDAVKRKVFAADESDPYADVLYDRDDEVYDESVDAMNDLLGY